jgi:hypothetical protein
MTSLPLVRTEYWNVSQSPPIPRTGSTAHGESITDMEGYLLPAAQTLASSLHGGGVAEGLTVSAVSGQAGLTVAPGVAFDVAGRLIALAAGGSAVVDPNAGSQVQGVATVPVTQDGLVFATDGISGDFLLTITWREVFNQGQVGNAPVLMHAPWLRLTAVAGFADDEQVVLARASLDSAGLVTGLSAGVTQADGSLSPGRQSLVTQGTQVALRAPAPTGTGLAVGDVTAGTLLARDQATLELAAGQGSVSVVAAGLSVRTADDPQGTHGIGLDAATSTLTAGTLQVGGTQSGISLSAGPAVGELGVGAARLAVRAADGTERISLDGTTSTVGAGSVLVGGTVSITSPSAGVLALEGIGGQAQLGVGSTTPTGALAIRGVFGSEELISFEDAAGHTAWRINQNPGGSNPGLNIAESGAADVDGRLFVQPGGNLGVNTTAPTNPLHVSGNRGIRQNSLYVSGGPGWSSITYNAHHDDNNSAWVFPDPSRRAVTIEMDDSRFQVWTTTSGNTTGWIQRFAIDANTGHVGIGVAPSFNLQVAGTVCADQFCNPSDLRLKRDITPLTSVLDRFAGIRAVRYRPDRPDDGRPGRPDADGLPRPQIGVLAQDVQAAFPELVVETAPGGLKAVDYAGLSGVLVGAVHELLARNAVLAARLAKVEQLVPVAPAGEQGPA